MSINHYFFANPNNHILSTLERLSLFSCVCFFCVMFDLRLEFIKENKKVRKQENSLSFFVSDCVCMFVLLHLSVCDFMCVCVFVFVSVRLCYVAT